ncbi:hypothetical protein GE061_017598 [Apolygus lucorum]|uniref:BTB domain-containing protein n=1 Tax=Apolygus lucorum TaxID=248454 RepID=A0A8S9XFG3_APOLU|nr:hypothetical protein GE061_017598 [Apolygus lucorum]
MFRPSGPSNPAVNRAHFFYSSMEGEEGVSSPRKDGKRKASNDVQIDNSQHVLVKIATLYAERLMNDICLIVGGVEYPAHRLILCASSEVFQVMLMNPQWSESHESRVVLKETPACSEIFGEFIKYFYTGKIKINQEIITPLLALADKYNVKDLIDLCVEYMCSHIALAASNNQLVTWYQYTLSLGHNVVALACQDFLKWNFETVAKGRDFGNCNQEILSRLLQWNDLVVTNEITLFHFIESWLEYQQQALLEEGVDPDVMESYLETLVYEVMSHVRFPMMSPRQLAELLVNPLTKKYKEFFIERMAIGMSFHNNQQDRIAQFLEDDTGRLLFTPRLYTSETFCSTLTIDNFTQFSFYQTRSLISSSPSGLAEHLGDKYCDWVVDFSPRGVWFPKSLLIVWRGTVEVPESVLGTVRVSITCKDETEEYIRVKIGLLVVGLQDGIEHIIRVVQKIFYFNKDDRLLNIDHVIPFEELNHSAVDKGLLFADFRFLVI